MEGGLGIAVAVKEQGVTGSAVDGPVVEPGVSVGGAPECDAFDFVAVLEEEAEDVLVALGELLLLFFGQTIDVRVHARVAAQAQGDIGAIHAALLGEDVDVEFGDVHLHASASKGNDAGFDVIDARLVNPPMPLHPDAINADVFAFEVIDHRDDGISLRLTGH